MGETMNVFKKCTCCDEPWFSRDKFLDDCNIDFVGYQVNFGDLQLGYFLFNHLTCGSTFAVPAGLFRNLYDGPVFAERLTGSESCPGYCVHEEILQSCNAKCECAYVRAVMQIVRNWPKPYCQMAIAANEG
jgi:hypothetical protein